MIRRLLIYDLTLCVGHLLCDTLCVHLSSHCTFVVHVLYTKVFFVFFCWWRIPFNSESEDQLSLLFRQTCLKQIAIAQIPLASRHDTHDASCVSWCACRSCCACRAVLVPTWRTTKKQYSSRVYNFSILCSGFASISGTTYGKIDVDVPPYAVAPPLDTCRASRACRARCDEFVAPWCPTIARHNTSRLFSVPKIKMHGLDSVSCRVVSCSVVTWRNEWNLGLYWLLNPLINISVGTFFDAASL